MLASTFLGGAGDDSGYAITRDSSGNVYVTGSTNSSDFPATSGAYDTTFNSIMATDVFISKLDSGLTSLLASTYLGGYDGDYGRAIAIDAGGNVYVAGYTNAANFPTTGGAYSTTYNGGSYDIFVSKLNNGLTSLQASTFLGGSNNEYGKALAIDTSGNIYVMGYTDSTDFPTTSRVYSSSYNGGFYDVFVSKLDSGLTSLSASTYLGGSGDDNGYAITLDTGGNVYVTGYTDSRGFPTTSGSYDTSYNGSEDVFISKLNSGLTSLQASTFLGSSSSDYGKALAIDTSGNIYVMGYTASTDFPITSGVYDTTYNGGTYDVFVANLDGGLTNLQASTYLGGANDDYGYSLAIDTSGNVYMAGYTDSTDFPVTSGSYNTSHNGGEDVFVSKLNSGLTSLQASTYLGGSGTDDGYSLTLDAGGNVYVTGQTASTGFPATNGAYDTSFNNGAYDVFVSKLDGDLSASLPPTVITGTATGITSSSATLNGTVTANGLPTTAWFNYGTVSASYTGTSTTQSVSGTSSASVSIGISGLSAATTYYYRIAANNSVGTSTGRELSFSTAAADTTAPSGSATVNSNATYVTSTAATLNLTATDGVGVTDYYASESATTPLSGASGWTAVTATTSYSANVSFTLSNGDGAKTVYVWYKDAAGNVSSAASDSITLDTTAPTVSSQSPASGATGVALSSTITATFSESMNASSITTSTFTVNNGVNNISGSVSYSGTTATFTPSSSLSSYTTYTVTVTTGVTDAAGNAMAANVTWRFITADTTAPSGSATINSNATYTTSTAVTLNLTATDNVGVTGYYASETATAPLSGAAGWTTVTSATGYSANAPFTLSNGDGAKTVYVWYKDATGNVSSAASDSITLDTTAPTIISKSPAAGTTGVALTSTITASFSESMNSSTITTTTFTVNNGANNISGSVSYSGTTATFTPSSGLSSYTTYTATVTTSVTDAAGNAMAANVSWSFTTTDTTAPSGSATINSNATYAISTAVTLNLTATDNVGVTGYYASETATTPSSGAAGWTAVTSTASYGANVSFTLSSSNGSKTVYVWYKDVAGNVSSAASDSITLDTTAPTIDSKSPAAGATGVALTSTITATFSESMNSSTITTSTFTVNNGANNISGNVSYSGTTATFTPSSNLSSYTTYTVTVMTGVTDAAGNAMAANVSWSFTTTDTTSPGGLATINSNAAYTTSTAVTLNLTASDNVGVTGYYASESATTPSSGDAGWTAVTSTASYSANVSFSLSNGDGAKTVYVWFKDAAGNVSSAASDSITLDTTAPVISSKSPANGATGVALVSTITAIFSESMNSSTITTTTFTVNNGASNITGSVSYSGTTATFAPSTNLSSNTTYTVTITTGVADAAGNAMAANNTWSFTTADANVPSGLVTINSNAAYTTATAVTLNLTATDNTGVTGYYASESSTAPLSTDAGWTSVTSAANYSADVSFTLSSSNDSKTVYVWYKDAAGNVSGAASDSITLDTTAPTISSKSPAAGATGVALASTVAATFSESMNSSTITTTTFTVNNGASNIGGSVSYSGTTATFTPSSGLSSYTTYTVTVTTGVTDAAGNAMEANVAWSFTTADTMAPGGSATINSNATYSTSTSATLNLTAADSVGVTGYYASETATPPVVGRCRLDDGDLYHQLQRKRPVYHEQRRWR
ncbi:MAG: hypothetical protein HW390_1035 [Candidatus Brocadiaceae bacterium]|nr:hypothetical protein [Candidatus Brocadiaceae bacterium]